jgi:hypothetical protein
MNALLILPLVALGAAFWLVARSFRKMEERVDAAESRLARRFYTLQGRVTEMGVTVRELDFERRRAAGEIRVSADMPLKELLDIHPKVREILTAFGLTGGGCSGPGLDESQTLLDACRSQSLDPRSLIGALEGFLRDPDAPIDARVATTKLYQIRSQSSA